MATATRSSAADSRSRRQWILGSILFLSLVKQLVLVVAYPPFQGHDEVAHLGYVRVVAEERRLPTLFDDLPIEYGPWSRYGLDWPALYTANHPPLYHLLAAPVSRVAADDPLRQLYLVRLVAVPLLLLTVWMSGRLAATLFPADAALQVAVPAVIAAQPQLSFEGAIVNNDMLSILLGVWLLWRCAALLRAPVTVARVLELGLILGLGLLAKATLLTLAPVVAGAVMYASWVRARGAGWVRHGSARLTVIGGAALLVTLPWYVFLWRSYGDVTVFAELERLQAIWGPPGGSYFELLSSPGFHRERIHETFGYFGWKLVPLGTIELLVVQGLVALVLLGGVVALARAIRRWGRGEAIAARGQLEGVTLLLAACGAMYAGMIYFGTVATWTQARYFFAAAPAAAILALLALRELAPPRHRATVVAAAVVVANVFHVVVLTRLVLPYGLR